MSSIALITGASGGPQPAEVERMLGTAQTALRNDKAWMQKTRQGLKDADAKLNKAFSQVLGDFSEAQAE